MRPNYLSRIMAACVLALAMMVTCFASNGEVSNSVTKESNKAMKKLVAYFSATGTTRAVAIKIANAAQADIYEIFPKVPYTSADLDWTNKSSRSSVEMADPKSRPQIANKNAKVEDYDVIFLGFPIWWYVAPTIINTFLESYNFAGKTVVLFATSGSSDLGKTADKLQPSAPKATFIEGGVLNGKPSQEKVNGWYNALNLK